jgi:hypothetical protein
MYQCQQHVPTSTADIQLAKTPSIAFVKIDVEGAESSVLQGMTATIERCRPPMLIEVMPYAYLLDGSFDRSYFGHLTEGAAKQVAAARRDNCFELEAFFQECDYRYYYCFGNGQVCSAGTLDRGLSRDRECDFLVLPNESAGAFEEQLMSLGCLQLSAGQ